MMAQDAFAGPDDQYNRVLVSNGHPSDWVNPEPASKYDLVVIGAGTAGLVTAAGAAGLGAKVALVERHLMGGDCLNVGCVPSKALIRAARACADVRDAGNYGVRVPPGASADFPKVMEHMRRLRAEISPNDSVQRFKKLGVDVFLGEAKFVGPDTVEAVGKRLRFSKAVIATGARAARLPIPGLWESGGLTNETIFSLTELPRRLLVIGAGPIGVELAQSFARFGSRVILFEAMHGILPREDADASELIRKSLDRDQVDFLCCVDIERVSRRGAETVVEFKSKHGRSGESVFDAVLVGVGRAPNVEGLGLEAAGVKYDKTGVLVDDRLQTSNPQVYAAGDICSAYKFTHAADAMARIAIQNALFLGRKKASALTIPWCTYTDPEIAHVGLYEKDAKDKGIELDTFVHEFKDLDRAILDGESEGLIKVHVEKGSDKILGATIVARHAGEMIGELTLAMTVKTGLGKIAATIHPYPTQAECVKRVADAYNRTRLTPLAKGVLGGWLRITRALAVGFLAVALGGSVQKSHAFDTNHRSWEQVLKKSVRRGLVDYKGLKESPQPLEQYLGAIGSVKESEYEAWTQADKMSFWINAYNALTLKAILDHYPIRSSFAASLRYPKNSIRQIPGVWDKLEFQVMGRRVTLDKIEHETLRKKFPEPRVHMALVCASAGCPVLRGEAYTGLQLEKQLEDQTRAFLSIPEKFKINRDAKRVSLSPIFKWFGEDFVKAEEHAPAERAVLNFISRYLDEKEAAFLREGKFAVKYLDYDWSLNEKTSP